MTSRPERRIWGHSPLAVALSGCAWCIRAEILARVQCLVRMSQAQQELAKLETEFESYVVCSCSAQDHG